ncbi:hypothetical protein [Streptomyces sp. PT12]|uniref:hypothetical protein n=1 Tax=Streptomyces sp. PT12 TaxID=1510197 RepID=UPI0011BD44F1|nr:hypothetical protein [Streptomyces sp. PT12]
MISILSGARWRGARGARRGALCAAALLAAVSGAAPAWAGAADRGSSGGLGAFASLGQRPDEPGALALAEGQATYPAGPRRVSLATVAFGDAGSAHDVTASASGDAATGRVRARAGVGDAALDLGTVRLRVGAVHAECSAAPGAAPLGSATVEGAAIAVRGAQDVALEPRPAPGTTVALPGGAGRAYLNERITEADGALTVHALRLRVGDREVTLGSVTCRPGTGATDQENPA